jgi:hypothetical protein
MGKYRITVSFDNEVEEFIHEGNLKDGMKKAWNRCAERKQNPKGIIFTETNTEDFTQVEGWQTVAPVERMD